MSQATTRASVRGDMLNCFTSAIATYLSSYGLDYTLACGLQLYLAMKCEEQQDGLAATFIHHHRPLGEGSPLFTLHLTRRWSDMRDLAEQHLLQELHQKKHLLAVGDAYNLPWQIHYGRKHAPHWFVVDEIDDERHMVHVRDTFEFIDAHDIQKPFDSWLSSSDLVDLTKVHEHPSSLYLARDLHSLGSKEELPLEAYHGYQWFETVAHVEASPITAASIKQELIDSYEHMTGARQREDLVRQGWLTGFDTVAALPAFFREHLANPRLYEMRDDFWVAGRQRSLFAHALRSAADLINRPALEDLAVWCEATLIPLWTAIPRVMFYNASCIQRQRAPRQLLIQHAEEVHLAEIELMRRLETCLSGWERTTSATLRNATETPEQWNTGKFVNQRKTLAHVEEVYVAPENELESLLAEIWMSVLGLSQISTHANFFRIGGNSLTATQALTRLSHMLQLQFSLSLFLEHPTIAELASVIEEALLKEIAEPLQ